MTNKLMKGFKLMAIQLRGKLEVGGSSSSHHEEKKTSGETIFLKSIPQN